MVVELERTVMKDNLEEQVDTLRDLLIKHDFFDETFYLLEHRDVRLSDLEPLEHYCRYGVYENRRPNERFDPDWYLSVYSDVNRHCLNPVIHYLTHGRLEGRFSSLAEMEEYERLIESSEFDLEFYKRTFDNLSELAEDFDFVSHYVRLGQYEGRRYKEERESIDLFVFDDDVSEDTYELKPDEFDPKYYLKENPDVEIAGVDPESHYFSSGESEGRKPNPYFDPAFYKRINADVRKVGVSPFEHFRNFGFGEGRLGAIPGRSQSQARLNGNKALLFVGHDGIKAGSEVVLLEVVRWFFENTARRLKVLLLSTGPVSNEYALYADVYVLPHYVVDESEVFQEFLDEEFEFAYLNTVVSGKFFELLNEEGVKLKAPVLSHIHEMEKVIEEYKGEMELLLENATAWISASPASTKTLIEKYKISREKITTVPAFINPVASLDKSSLVLRKQARESLGLAEDSLVVAGCGTVYWRKGTDIFIETAKAVKAKTNKKCEFIWIGDGPDRAELESSLEESEREYIKFAGNRSDANVMLAAADIFFLSSREDPFPLVVLESAQYGIPSLCFGEATGITEFVKSDAGVVISELSSNDAAHEILKLIDNPSLRIDLGKCAKQRLFEGYTTSIQNIKIFEVIQKQTKYKPSVSVIVPFYNHEKYIVERLDSILRQSIKDIEIIALDDCSTDNSVQRIEQFAADSRFKLFLNDKNSGSPFKQWEKGIREAKSDIIWIAEGDDSCDQNFIEQLLPYFNDEMVNIAAAKTDIINENGILINDALMPYLDTAFCGKFDKSYIKDGFVEVNEQFGAMCTLVNASALLIRKSSFGDSLKYAKSFKMCGDWLIYLECLKNGKIAYDVNTRNLFRRHSASQVHKVEGSDVYFKERFAITDYVVENYSVSKRLLKKSFNAIDHEWERFRDKHPGIALDQYYSKATIKSKARFIGKMPHVAFYVHGMTFSKGGIERLAAQLSNYLAENGWRVTIYCRLHGNSSSIYSLYESIKLVPLFDEHDVEYSSKALNQHLSNSDVDVFVPMLSEWIFEPVVEAAKNAGVAILASEHNDPWKIEELWWSNERRIKCFESVDRIHLLLNKFSESLPEYLHDKVVTIPNGVKLPEEVDFENREKLIVSVGRLEEQKGFDRLIKAVGIAQKTLRKLGYRVEIFGEGALKEELLALIQVNDIEDLVFLMGTTSEIEDVYRRADFFVIPSVFEGFGMVVVEALAYGLPAIGFQDCNGPNEIIRHGIEGALVCDIEELSCMLEEYASSNLEKYRNNALQRAEVYSLDKFYSSWLETLNNIVAG